MNRLAASKLIALAIGLTCILLAYNYNKSATYKISGSIYGTYWQLVSTEYISDSLIKSIKDSDFSPRNLEEHLQKVLEWKKDPEIFIKELLEQPTQDTLHEAIKDKLAKNHS